MRQVRRGGASAGVWYEHTSTTSMVGVNATRQKLVDRSVGVVDTINPTSAAHSYMAAAACAPLFSKLTPTATQPATQPATQIEVEARYPK